MTSCDLTAIANSTYQQKSDQRPNYRAIDLKTIPADRLSDRDPRATFTSHCLMSGMNPLLVAQLTGHDVAVLFEHYAAYIGSSPEIPNLF